VTDLLAGLDALTALRVAVKAAAYGASLLAAGLALFHLVHRADPATERATRRLAAASAAAGIVLAVATVAGEVVFLMGGDVAAVRDLALWQVVLATPIGDAQTTRMAGLVAVALLAWGPGARWPAAAGALAVAASFALVGHSLAEPRPALALLVALHVAAAAYWIGAFAPLHRVARTQPPAAAGALAQAFGRAALGAVAVLVIAGGLLVVLLAGGPMAALASDWGVVLLVKLALVAGLLALAALNKLRLSPALAAGEANAAAGLRRSIRREAGLAALVLLVTVAMTSLTTPPEPGTETTQLGSSAR
jgi:putative copper resistance protein D